MLIGDNPPPDGPDPADNAPSKPSNAVPRNASIRDANLHSRPSPYTSDRRSSTPKTSRTRDDIRSASSE
jgi:hypothetical protein